MGIALKSMKDNAEIAEKFMWLAPGSIKSPAGAAFSFVGAIGKIDEAVRNLDRLQQIGMTGVPADAFVAITAALDCVPALGGFFSAVMGAVQEYFVDMNQQFRDTVDKNINLSHSH